MFNILTDELPNSVVVGGLEYTVNWDAGSMLKIVGKFDGGLFDCLEMLKMFYVGLPTDLAEGAKIFTEFYRCEYGGGANKRTGNKKTANKRTRPVYSFEADANLIFAAFVQQYGVLRPGELHWYTFKALLDGLTDDCLFVKVVGIRGAEISDKMTADERVRLKRAKRAFALETDGGFGGDFGDCLWKMG